MRVLWLDHPEGDYLAAPLYMGLCEELGDENVVDFPYKPSFHGQLHNYPRPWHQGEIGHTAPFAWMKASSGRRWEEHEVYGNIESFEIVIVAAPRPVAMETCRSLISKVGRAKLHNLVLVDGEDYVDIRWDFASEIQPKVYFKRELSGNSSDRYGHARGGAQSTRLVPFSFCSPIPPRAAAQKDIDVLMCGGGTWNARQSVCNALQRELGSQFVGGHNVHFGYDQYLDAINRSKIAVSVRGHGMDTLRFFEIPSFETMLLADKLPLQRCIPFEDGRTAVYFDGETDLINKVRHYLANDEARIAIAKLGNQHLRDHHTARARARQLIEEARR